MSTSVDNRVVQLQFDNKNFEKNVGRTLNSLDKLEYSLQLKGAGKGLEQLDQAASKVDFSKMGKATELITKRLSTMGLVGVNVLNRISNKAINTAEQVYRAFMIQPPKDGFAEYELKMGSVQTIVASTGESLSVVNDYLEELNKYSDKTIYSFKDMTASIGKFTNAGVPLEQAVLAIQGISNEAAVSGANAEEASRAMYNFSQALSAGYVKLIDWKSIENANMATREFKQELINTAVAMGTLTEAHDGMYKAGNMTMNATKNFNDSLQKQWMTSEVLIETLRKYADETTTIGKKAFAAAQDIKTYHQLMDTVKESIGSGWAQISEIIFGDLDEAKKLWTSIGNSMSEFIDNSFGGVIDFLKNNLQSNYKKFLSSGAIADINKFNKDYQEAVDEQKKPLQDEIDANNRIIDSRANALNELDKYNQRLKEMKKNGGWFENEKGEHQWWMPEPKEIEHSASEISALTKRNEYLEKQLADNTVQADVFGSTLLKQYDDASSRMKELMDTGYSFDEGLKKLGFTREQWHNMMKWRNGIRDGSIDVEALVASFDEVSRREKIFNSLGNTFKFVGSMFKPISNAFKNVFFGANKDELWLGKLIDRWDKWSSKLKISDETMTKVTKTFEAMFGWVHNLGSWALPKLQSALSKVSSFLGKAIAGSVKFIDVLIDHINPIEQVGKAYDWIVEKGEKLEQMFHKLFNNMRNSASVGPIIKAFEQVKDEIVSIFNTTSIQNEDGSFKMLDIIDRVVNTVKALPDILGRAFGDTENTFGTFISNFKEYFNELGRSTDESLSGLYASIKTFGSKVKNKVIEIKDWFTDNLDVIISGAYVTLMAYRIFKFVSFMDDVVGKVDNFVKIIEGVPKALTNAINKISNAQVFKTRAQGVEAFAAALFQVSKAIGVISAAIWLLTKVDTDGLSKGVKVLAIVVALLAGLSIAVSKMGDWKGAISIGALAGVLIAVIYAVDLINGLTINKDTIGSKFAVIIGVIIGLGVVYAIITHTAEASLGNLKSVAVIVALVLALYAVIGAIKMIEKIDINYESLENTLIKIGIILGLLIAVVLILRFGTAHSAKAGAGILAMVASMFLLIGVFKLLEHINGETIAKGILSLTAMFLPFWAFMKAIGKAGKDAHKAGAAILAIGLAILPLTFAAKILGKMDLWSLTKGIGALIGVMFSLGLVLQMGKMFNASFKSLIGLVAVIATLGIIIGGLSALAYFTGWESVLTGAGSLALVLVALGGAFALMSHFGSSTWSGVGKFIVQIGVMSLVVAGIAGLIYALSTIENPETAIAMTVLLGGFLGEMTLVMLACTLAGSFGPAAFIGLGVLGALIAECGLIVAAAAGLGQIDGASEFIDKGIEILNKIGQGIGGFFGGIGEGLMASAEKMSAKLISICDNIKTAFAGFSVPYGLGKTVDDVSSALIKLTAGEMLDSIGKMLHLSGDFSGMKTKLESLGSAISGMGTKLEGVTTTTVRKVDIAAQASAKLVDVIKPLSETKMFSGGQSKIESSKLTAFGTAVTDFAGALSGIAADNIKIDTGKITDLKTAGDQLVELAKQIPNFGGDWAELWGDNKMDDFGTQITSFADSISQAGTKSIELDNIKDLAKAGNELNDMAKEIEGIGGIWDAIFGKDDAATFGENINSFAESIETVGRYQFDQQTLDELDTCTDKLCNIATLISGAATDNVDTFITKMTSFVEWVDGVSVEDISGLSASFETTFASIHSIINVNMPLFTIKGAGLVQAITSGVAAMSAGPVNAMTAVVKSMYSAIVNRRGDFISAGRTLITLFANSISANAGLAKSAASTVVNGAVSALTNYGTDTPYSAGAYFVQGFANGISYNIDVSDAAAWAMGHSAVLAAKNGAQEKSPSKATYKIGRYFVQGFVNALNDYQYMSDDAADEMSVKTVSAVASAIKDISSIINDKPEMNPVIRPVVDMSEVQSSAKELSSIYGDTQVGQIAKVRRMIDDNNVDPVANTTNKNVNLSYVQNNYSPKPLSRIDIYRQTKNQIALVKGTVM